MDFSKEKRKKLTLWIISVFSVCCLIYLGVQNIGTVASAVKWCINLIMPLILGTGFAMVLDVPMKFFENHLFTKTKKATLQKLKTPLSLVISVIVIVLIVTALVVLVIPELIEAVKVIINIVTDFVTKLTQLTQEDIEALPFGEYIVGLDWKGMLSSALDWIKNRAGTIVNTAFDTIGSVVTGVLNLFLGFVFAAYILLNKKKLKEQGRNLIRAWLPEKAGSWLLHAAKVGNENFKNFVSGQTLEAVILGVLCMVGMFILRIPYAPMVGALVGVTALIPVVGGVIGAAIGALMILTVSPVKALIFIVFLIILQNLEGDLIYPRVMGSRVKLPAMWILAAVTIGGSIAGPIGMLLSVPVASTAYCLINEATEERLERKHALKAENEAAQSEEKKEAEEKADTENDE